MARPDPRRRALSRLKFAIVALVAASAGLISLYAGGTPVEMGLAVGGGGVLGTVLAWLALP